MDLKTKTKEAKVILLDIEGTTTAISFVEEILFPYAAKHVEQFLKDNWNGNDIQEIVKDLRKENEVDVKNGMDGVVKILSLDSDSGFSLEQVQESIILNILWQMKHNMKRTGLKAIQGKIWKIGFEKGHLLGQLFDDVPKAFEAFRSNGQIISIYSSGSVQAQKLLFKYSTAGDLSSYISDYFDTRIGAKIEGESYKSIARALNVDPSNILFFTDVVKEGIAGREGGVDVVIMIRPGNAPLSPQQLNEFSTANTFEELTI
jgi:enolase-phosphatase E1